MSVLYAQVIVDIVHENVAHTFTYRIPDGMTLTAGQRVEVPFGRIRKEGVVLSLTQETDVPPEKLRDVLRPLEDYAAICPTLLTLAQQMADDVHCPLAETLRLMLPEFYLGKCDEAAATREIQQTMRRYLDDGVFRTVPHSLVLVQRTLPGGAKCWKRRHWRRNARRNGVCC